ncbi:MAG TPA: pectin acetylesterase-family hydrolase [Spirochaetota bacterium]|nr:pectin acetylesterase-family hydrolase [Spirochaetota bacterium]HSA13903.1 pectin acetylesterase-family hydrolase [Spirochaetota bacterium]
MNAQSRLRMLYSAAVLAVVVSVMSCSDSDDDRKTLMEELSAIELDKYIDTVPYMSHEPYGSDPTWEIYSFDTSVCKCITGNSFHIGVKSKSATDNVVFLMSGGGACWPGRESCSETADFMTGWDDVTGNPLNGWSVIHVPYCDGSVHMGDNDADYDGDSAADHFHRGLQTTSAGLAIMRELFPNPPKIFITGCSAGGYGTFIAYLLNRRFFPDSSMYILNDSGPGLSNPDNGMITLVKDAWQYMQYMPSSCSRCGDQLMHLYDWILQRDPMARIGLFSSYHDRVIGGSFLDMADEDFRDLLVSTSDEIRSRHPGRFSRFLIEGDTHCVGEVAGGYSYAVGSVTLLEWITQLVNDDPDWPDVLE